jgi:hypothetical protein
MNRLDFQKISELRVQEAETLLRSKQPDGSYYLMGYAVECALKACVCKQVKEYDFPNKEIANKAHTHDLEQLLKLSGLDPGFKEECKVNENLTLNWATVKDWSESKRYETGITEAQASDFHRACTGKDGILEWIKRKW